VALEIQLRDLAAARENDISSHQTRFLGSQYTKNAFVARARPEMHFWFIYGIFIVSFGCKCCSIAVEQNIKLKQVYFFSEYAVCYRAVACPILSGYFLFYFVGVLTRR